MSSADRARVYIDYLSAEGFRPEIDSDDDIVFKSEGLTYCILMDDGDDEFFRVLLPNFWKLDSDQEILPAAEAVNYANSVTKLAKLTIRKDRNTIDASVELLLKNPADIRHIFLRSLGALQLASRKFAKKMHDM